MLHAALIGLPATGKSTLFQLMTSAKEGGRSGKGDTVVGISKVPDARLDRLTAMFNPRKRVPATIEFTDSAGPARAGASALVDVAGYKNADALVHVVRAFRDEAVPHPSLTIDPERDAQAMEDELILADLGVVERRMERLEKDLKKSKTADLEKEWDILTRAAAALADGQPLRALGLAGDDLKRLRGFQFLSAKPLLVVINLDEAGIASAADVAAAAQATGLTPFLARAATGAVPVCAKIELEIAQLEAADAAAFLSDLGLAESGLDRVIRASYDLLGYMSFFTVGEDECRAWSIPRGTPAQLAAGEIHSDIQRGFIRAEVVGYDALVTRGSMAACKEAGEVRLEGKEYVVQDGDVINFRHAT
jgi:GTP-binding protein YchF